MEIIFKKVRLRGSLTDITVRDGVIASILPTDKSGQDMDGMMVYPGLFDIHSHGCVGQDTMMGDGLDAMSEYLYSRGITAWLPTTTSAPLPLIQKVTARIPAKKQGRAEVLGYHIEGPFISKAYKGAMAEQYLSDPDPLALASVRNAAMVTLAPELPGALDMIRSCKATVSLGHTACDYDTAEKAFEQGARCVTHLFNAMPPFLHREPSLVGAALTKGAYVQVIADGLHLHPSVVLAAYRMFGPDRMILISDSICATGLCDGTYSFFGYDIHVKNGQARTPDGALCGSTTDLAECVRRAISFGIPADDAFKMASETPYKLLRIKRGVIKPGYPADMIFLNDRWEVCKVFRP